MGFRYWLRLDASLLYYRKHQLPRCDYKQVVQAIRVDELIECLYQEKEQSQEAASVTNFATPLR